MRTIFACRSRLACLWLVVLFLPLRHLRLCMSHSVVEPAAHERVSIALDAMAPGVYAVNWWLSLWTGAARMAAIHSLSGSTIRSPRSSMCRLGR